MSADTTSSQNDSADGATTSDWKDNPWVAFVFHVLRGVSQVVLQNNALTGVFILLGIFWYSIDYGLAAVAGVIVATLTAMLFKCDKGMIAAGLFGFNGVLVGIAIVFHAETSFHLSDISWWVISWYILFGAGFSTIVTAALGAILSHVDTPPLTGPFVFTTWLIVAGVHFSPALNPGHIQHPANVIAGSEEVQQSSEEAESYTFATWWVGIGKGISEIFFTDSAVTGYLMLLGILINTRLGALMAFLGGVISILIAELLGVRESPIHMGMWTYSAVLTAIALGGLFYLLTWRSFVYTIIGIIITTWVYAAFGSILAPLQLTPYTFPFVLVTWLMMMPKAAFAGMVPVPPAEATTPEDNLRRYRESRS